MYDFLEKSDTLVGGMGVLVFVMVLTNLDKQSSIHLMRAEVPGPEKDKLVPKSRTTAQILYGIVFYFDGDPGCSSAFGRNESF